MSTSVYIIAVILTDAGIRRFIAQRDVVQANLELVAVLVGGTAWGFINYFSDGIPPYAAVKGAPADLALQVSAVAWCVIGCGALVMALCSQIEHAGMTCSCHFSVLDTPHVSMTH